MNGTTILSELLAKAEISINGKMPWDIQVHDSRFYRRVLTEPDLGFGESYMDGWWDCEALDECVNKINNARVNKTFEKNWKTGLYAFQTKLFNLQNPSRAFQVSEQHYDLGNDLYQAMLDTRLNYTSAYWKDATTLDQAQEAKLDLVCRKINLNPGMKILELGCGWGSFAKYAAEKYGAHIVALNISKEQVKLARELCKGLPVDIRLQDYRDADGSYDAVISIGILEHVGYKNYREYMEVVNRCLKDDGIAFIHTIGRNTSATYVNRWIDKYIFPNGMLPSIAQIATAMEGIFVMEDWHNFGPDYDRTLMAWYHNFEHAWPELKDRYSDRFYRMWRFYLMTCAGSFRSRTQQLWQIVMTKPGRVQPNCRIS